MDDEDKKSLVSRLFSPLTWLLGKIFGFIKALCYNISVAVHQKVLINKKVKSSISKRKTNERLFLAILFTWPIICFFVGYVAGNVNSFLLAFQSYDEITQSFHFVASFTNFTRIFRELQASPQMFTMITNSLVFYLFDLIVCGSISLFVSFMIYKKIPAHKFFVVILFLPAIVSNIVWVIIYKHFLELGLPIIMRNPDLLSVINNPNSSFLCLLIFGLWLGLGGGLLINTSAMSRIPKECVEAANIEGCGLWREFWKITFPLIFQTWSVGIVCGVVLLFTGSPNTFAFFGNDAPIETWTFGYYFFKIIVGGNNTMSNYPYASAAGLMFTAVVAPLTFVVKWAMSKGPSAEL